MDEELESKMIKKASETDDLIQYTEDKINRLRAELKAEEESLLKLRGMQAAYKIALNVVREEI